MYVDDKLPERVYLTAIVDLPVQLSEIEALLILEDWFKDLCSILVEDVSAGSGDVYLREEFQGDDVLAVELQVLLQELSVLAHALNRIGFTFLKVR